MAACFTGPRPRVAVVAVGDEAIEHFGIMLADLLELGDAEAARRAGRRCQADAEVIVGFSGSNGTPFLLQVMLGALERFLGGLPVSFLGRRSTSIRWVSVPPETSARPPSTSVDASALALSTTALRIDLELGLQRLAEGDGLAGDDVHQRAALKSRGTPPS